MDLARRGEYERDLARVMGRTLRQQYNAVMDALGDNPSLDKLTPALFEAMKNALQAAIRPLLERVYRDHVEALTKTPPKRVKQGGIGIEWGLVNERAAEWASGYSLNIAGRIVNTTQKTLRKQVADFFQDERTLKDLRDTLSPLFGPVRADLIGTTEITVAASAGEAFFEGELNRLGLKTTQIWQTENDDLVCPICGPRHGKKRGDGWTEPPPAHGRCRCHTNTVVVDA